jgi:hypothetical protein
MFIAAWTGGWFWLKAEAQRRIDAVQSHLEASGGALSWRARQIGGYPFRLDVNFQQIAVRDRSGWGLAAPSLKTEAFVHSLDHWMVVAPEGLVITRPTGGPVRVRADALRASVSSLSAAPPRLSVEGLGLTFATPPGVRPFPFDSARELHLHTRAGPRDQGAVYFALEGARPGAESLLGLVGLGKAVTIIADGIYSHASALNGQDWAAALRRWSAAGGGLEIRTLRIAPGEAMLEAKAGRMSVGSDGRLKGAMTVALGRAPEALASLARAGKVSPERAEAALAVLAAEGPKPVVVLTVNFQAGETMLGPVAIGPAPKVY